MIKEMLFMDKIIVPLDLYAKRKELKICDEAFMFLIYLTKYKKRVLFDLNMFQEEYKLKKEEIYKLIEELLKSDLVEIKVEEKDKVKEEYLYLEPFYNKIEKIISVEEEKREPITNLYEIMEKELGRTLSPIEMEIINNWQDKGYKEELIKAAIKEAVFNGVTSFKYIDKILFNWEKNGIKKMQDLKNKERKEETIKINDYDWLEDES